MKQNDSIQGRDRGSKGPFLGRDRVAPRVPDGTKRLGTAGGAIAKKPLGMRRTSGRITMELPGNY